MNAQIVSVVRIGTVVVACARLNEGDGRGVVEYVATVPAVDQAGNALSPTDIKAALVAEWQRLRFLRPQAPADLFGQINGNVNL